MGLCTLDAEMIYPVFPKVEISSAGPGIARACPSLEPLMLIIMLYSVFLNNNSVNTCNEIHKREELVHTLQAKLEELPVYTYTVIITYLRQPG